MSMGFLIITIAYDLFVLIEEIFSTGGARLSQVILLTVDLL
jgi:hypothetical protein